MEIEDSGPRWDRGHREPQRLAGFHVEEACVPGEDASELGTNFAPEA